MRRIAEDCLSPAERRVLDAVIATRGGNITRVAGWLHVTYQAVANTLSVMYDKLFDDLDGNRTIQSLVDWYYRTDAGRRIGSLCLMWLFCAYTFGGGDNQMMVRRASRRGRRNEYEYLIEE